MAVRATSLVVFEVSGVHDSVIVFARRKLRLSRTIRPTATCILMADRRLRSGDWQAWSAGGAAHPRVNPRRVGPCTGVRLAADLIRV